MCKLKSGIILKNRVFVPEYDSHADMLRELGIEDNYLNASKTFVRVELSPKDGDAFSDIDTWELNVDQDIIPDWYDEEAYKPQVIEAVKKWAEGHIHNGVEFLDISTGRGHWVKDCYYVSITQNAEVKLICGNSTVDVIRDNAKVEKIHDNTEVVNIIENVRVGTIKDNVKVKMLWDNSIIENVTGNVKIGELYDYARIEELSGKAVIRNVEDHASVETIGGYANIESVDDDAVVGCVHEDAIIDGAWGHCVIKTITDRAMIKKVSGYSRVEGVYREATIKKASGCSIVINHSFSNWENKQKLKLSDGAIFQDETEDVIYHTKEWKCVEVES